MSPKSVRTRNINLGDFFQVEIVFFINFGIYFINIKFEDIFQNKYIFFDGKKGIFTLKNLDANIRQINKLKIIKFFI